MSSVVRIADDVKGSLVRLAGKRMQATGQECTVTKVLDSALRHALGDPAFLEKWDNDEENGTGR